MLKKSTLLALLGSLVVVPIAAAQQKPITGTVTNEQGSPIMAVSVVIKRVLSAKAKLSAPGSWISSSSSPSGEKIWTPLNDEL